mmetsp:Transcript_3826/g.11039  ORF Transcript_3826/g.11039 Transcript_3826/m.11039 type:complete len:247 (+) Transcript_3826:1938-2678(+)
MEEPAVERPCTSARQRARLGRSLTRMRVHLNSVAYTLSYRMMVGYSLRSASVNLSPRRKRWVASSPSTWRRAAYKPSCARSYPTWLVAKPLLYTPLLIWLYTRSLSWSIWAARCGGTRSTSEAPGSCRAFRLRTMSEDSLLTRRRARVSTTRGAVHRPLNPGWHSSYTSLRSLHPKIGSFPSKTQPPREARSGSSVMCTTCTLGSRLRTISASSTRWHHGHAFPTNTAYLPASTGKSGLPMVPRRP